jgi:hypothetical protein
MFDIYDAACAHEDMPGLTQVTLFRRVSGDTFDSGTIIYRARRKPPRLDLLIAAELVQTPGVFVWQLFGVSAKPSDRIVDAQGRKYEVKPVDIRLLSTVFDCLTVADAT